MAVPRGLQDSRLQRTEQVYSNCEVLEAVRHRRRRFQRASFEVTTSIIEGSLCVYVNTAGCQVTKGPGPGKAKG